MEKTQAIQMQMKKFGWKEGQGLGKNEQGRKEAIKVSIKNNKNGLGLDPSEQFVFHWWDHVFNKVASSIKIKDVDGEVTVSKCQDDGGVERISSKRPESTCKAKNLLYGRFVPSGTTVVGNETIKTNCQSSESDCEEEEDRAKTDFSNISTLEKAFEMSGGRTAHSAARHGSKLSGKLKRLQEQESKECLSIKKMKNCHEKRSKNEKCGINIDMQQVAKKSRRTAIKEARINRNSIGKKSSYKKSSNLMNKIGEQNMSSRTVMMVDTSSTAIEESTLGKRPSLSFDIGAQQGCKKRRKCMDDCRMQDMGSSRKDDIIKITERNTLNKGATLQIGSDEANSVMKKKKKKKRKKKRINDNGEI